MVLYAKYIPEDEAIKARKIFFEKQHVHLDLGPTASYIPQYEVYPENAQELYAPDWTGSFEGLDEGHDYTVDIIPVTGAVLPISAVTLAAAAALVIMRRKK
ncbi:MAG: hypothetical protein IKO44_04395 [Ruminococcus sp.]|nr:hypothetical protein [Ruminococcus sp.]